MYNSKIKALHESRNFVITENCKDHFSYFEWVQCDII